MWLERYLNTEFHQTLMVVSHDRMFLNEAGLGLASWLDSGWAGGRAGGPGRPAGWVWETVPDGEGRRRERYSEGERFETDERAGAARARW